MLKSLPLWSDESLSENKIKDRRVKNLNEKRNFFQTFLTPIFIGLIISAISFYVLRVLAAPPDSAYAPGATLNPSCTPGSANCTVTTPAISEPIRISLLSRD